jgi:hypothetical protein
VATFHGEAVIGTQTKTFDVDATSATLPPQQEVGILVPPDLSGMIQVTLEARDSNGNVLATGAQSGTIRVSDRVDLTITLGVGAASDMSMPVAGSDLGNDLGNGECSDVCAGTSLNVCSDGGFTASACALGCIASPAAHCGTFYPSGAVTPADLVVAGLSPITFSNTTPLTILHSDTGVIDGARAANGDPTKLEVVSGIGFHVVDGVGIFDFASITIPEGVTIGLTGPNPIALVSAGDLSIVGILNAGSTGGCNEPGPGGGNSGSATTGSAPVLTSAGGLGAGGNGNGASNSDFYGGGGGGHGATGGHAGEGTAGGAGGVAYDDATLIPLHGGSGGGAAASSNVCSGAGGGGLQLVSGGTIAIGGGTAVGGINAGGSGAYNGQGGGGSGGSVLLEAFSINLAAYGGIASNGGGGGGIRGGGTGTLSAVAALGGTGGTLGSNPVGAGGVGGVAGAIAGGQGGEGAGGGGAVGRIRLNSLNGAASLTGNAFLSPSEADRNSLSLPVATEGKIDIH